MLTSEQIAQGWKEHDGGPCPSIAIMAMPGKVMALLVQQLTNGEYPDTRD